MGSRQANAELRRWLKVVRFPRLNSLREEWGQLVKTMRKDSLRTEKMSLGSTEAENLWYDHFVKIYSGHERNYHNIQHIQNVIAWIHFLLKEQSESKCSAPLLAAWFHDLVYETGRQDNEEKSVGAMKKAAKDLAIPERVARSAADLILLTKTYAASRSEIANAFMDADLAILGAPPLVYERYSRAIRIEFAWVQPQAFRDGRKAVLTKFINRRRIYRTAEAHDLLEESARRNIEGELAQIEIPPRAHMLRAKKESQFRTWNPWGRRSR